MYKSYLLSVQWSVPLYTHFLRFCFPFIKNFKLLFSTDVRNWQVKIINSEMKALIPDCRPPSAGSELRCGMQMPPSSLMLT